MSKGEVIEEGTHDNLIEKKGHYYDLVTTQTQAYQDSVGDDSSDNEYYTKAVRAVSVMTEFGDYAANDTEVNISSV